jgi:sec-independent protein translocase protein TatC
MGDLNEKEMTFWDHLDELRKVFFRIVIAVLLLAGVAFVFKDFIFDIIFAPQRPDFIL